MDHESPVVGTRLLVIEDNDELRRAVVRHFEALGWAVEAARTLRTAVELATMHQPHIALTELILPDARGYRFVEDLRRAAPGIRGVIAATRMPRMVFEGALVAGFAEVLEKPVSLDHLRHRLEAVLGDVSARRGTCDAARRA